MTSTTMTSTTIHVQGAPQKTCARCNLPRDDDGRRFKIHRGRAFICAACKPDRGGR